MLCDKGPRTVAPVVELHNITHLATKDDPPAGIKEGAIL